MDSDTEDAFYTEPPRAAWQIVDIVDRDPKEHRKVWLSMVCLCQFQGDIMRNNEKPVCFIVFQGSYFARTTCCFCFASGGSMVAK